MLPDYQIFAATGANVDVLDAVFFLVVIKFSRHAVLLAVNGVLQCVCPVSVCFDSFDVLFHNVFVYFVGRVTPPRMFVYALSNTEYARS